MLKPCKLCGATDLRVDSNCAACIARATRIAYYAANRDKIIARNALYIKKNPERERTKAAKYRANNPDKVKAKNTAWRKANPERCAAHSKKYRAQHPEKFQASVVRWREKKPAKVKERSQPAFTPEQVAEARRLYQVNYYATNRECIRAQREARARRK